MDTPFSTGSIASVPDFRDGIAALAVVPGVLDLPATYRTELGSVWNQMKTPSCVSHSVAHILRLYWKEKTGNWVNFSPRFLDVLAKRYDGQDRATGGTYPRLVFKLAVQYGCATEDTLPNTTSLPTLQYRDDSVLTPEVFADAAKWKIPGYVRIANDKQSTREAIFLYGAVSTLFRVGNELYTAPDGHISYDMKDIDPLRTPKAVESGHQMSPNGWRTPDTNNLRNEWGQAWARNGENDYDPDAWYPFIVEQWAIAEIPSDVKAFLSKLPSPADFHYQWNKNLTKGQYSDDVKFAQVALIILGFLQPMAPEEFGHYGPKTARAVGLYQASKHIFPTDPNSIGPKTRSALNAQFSTN